MNVSLQNEGNVVQVQEKNDILIQEETNSKKHTSNYLLLKRIFDIILSILGIILLLPVFIIIAIAIKIDSKGPVFFLHDRIGKNGKPIKIYKFRTMVPDAEKMIKHFSENQKEEFERNFKLEYDPRVTKIGRFLRKTSLDELPQILNILKGELSIVGPRPVVAKELERYGENKEKFLSVTPGLTGYWQANGRSNTSYEQRMKMELYYIDNVSMWMDIKIFFKTFISVFKREGAV